VSPENNKEIKIDQIRDIIQFLKLKSKTGKVVIIENAEKMNIEASNSLLKTLEEPPEKTLIILTTSNITKLLPTIVSRTLKVKFSLLTDEEVKEILKIKGAVKKNIDMDILVSLAEGSLCLPEKILKNQALFNYAKDFFNLLISKVNHIEGIIRLAELIDKLEYEDIKVILTILDRYIYRKTLKGKISTELYERFISESKLLDRAIYKGVKKKLAFEGFYFKLVS
ncbi:MAG: DNA polymerase III subunit delta', partial [Persephonella sp.]